MPVKKRKKKKKKKNLGRLTLRYARDQALIGRGSGMDEPWPRGGGREGPR